MNVWKYALNDMKRNKVKTLFGIGGIFISLMLLTAIGSLNDSFAYSYLDQATYEVGSSDLQVSKLLSQDLNFDQFFLQDLQNDMTTIEEIGEFYPRIMTFLWVSHYDAESDFSIKKLLISYGINTTLEQNSGQMGNLWICEDTAIDSKGELLYERTDELYRGPIRDGFCLVTRGAAKLYDIQAGDEISVKTAGKSDNITVEAIVDQELRFSRVESSIVITELPWMQEFMGQEFKINNLYMTLAHPELVYDTRNMYDTTLRLEAIAIQVQNVIGFDYQVAMTRLQQLDANAMQSDSMNMTFYFISFFSIMITGILINSILTTSVEERIREFGVIRVCGARSKFTFQLVLISGFIMGFAGSVFGTLAGIAIGPPFLNWFFSTNFGSLSFLNFGSLEFIILPKTIYRSLLIGIISTTLISIFPALKASSINLSNAIDPARTASSKGTDEYRLKKEGSTDLKLMGIGLGIAATGIFIFLILPRILTGTGGPNLMNYILTGLLLMVLVGLVLITIGFVPVLESLISLLFKPFIKKFYPVYKLNLMRYRRRNVGNILMFAMSFSFIFFISSQLIMQSENTAVSLQFQYGSDLVISNTGYPDEGAVTRGLMEDIENIPGVSQVAPIVHNSFDVIKLTSMIFSIGEEGFDAFDFDVLFGSIPKLEAQIGDLGDYEEYYCSLAAIDENYYDLVDHSLVMWDEASGSSPASIDTLLSTSNSCIIAKSFADAFGITSLPATIKITMRDPNDHSVFRNISTFNVVGISRGFPGFWNFRSSQANLFTGGGVMLNMEDYARLLDWGDPTSPDFILDKIMIELSDDSLENMQEIQDYIKNYYGNDYSFIIDESVSKIQMMEESNQALNMIMQIILMFSILVSIFGLLSSMYSTILERMFELGILRAMGLKPAELRNMLMAEAVTILLSSGFMGAVVGWFIAFMLVSNVSVLTEMPAATAVNLGTLASTFLFSVGVSIVGMFFITRRVEKMQVIDVLRSSF